MKKNIHSAVDSLNSELKLFLSISNMSNKNLPISHSSVPLTREQWQSIYTKMMQIENATDSLFKDYQEISQRE